MTRSTTHKDTIDEVLIALKIAGRPLTAAELHHQLQAAGGAKTLSPLTPHRQKNR